ncbi:MULTISPECIES: hypothetical protein [unclassified Psychrobacter]|uniref:hypothetical protein n=1 Tax=unclassified Psychrobacter TaxID=196806 RepID=UPI0025D06D6F|nr:MULTISPECIES: hypothetical protein [unclassified Psychrobacter]
MKLSAKTISLNSNSTVKFHPLTRKLHQVMMNAYIISDKSAYLKNVSNYFGSRVEIPVHNISVIFKDGSYEIIGGCFSPIFDLNDISNDNTVILSYTTSQGYDTKNKTDEQVKRVKKRIQDQFDQDVINFIYMDYIRAISTLSLSKPGIMYPELKRLTQEYDSDMWNKIFGDESQSAKKNTFLLKHCAELLDKTRDTLIKQAKLLSDKIIP